MTDADRIASLATIAARLEMARERVALHRVPVSHLVELNSIQGAVEKLRDSYAPKLEREENENDSVD